MVATRVGRPMCPCGQCRPVSTSEGTWCQNTGVELCGPEHVMHYSDHHSSGGRIGKVTQIDRARACAAALRKSMKVVCGAATIHGCLAALLCDGKVRQMARASRRGAALPAIKNALRPLLKQKRKSDPTLAEIALAMQKKTLGFPRGTKPGDERVFKLVGLVQTVIQHAPPIETKTAQRGWAMLVCATLVWKMGAAGFGGDVQLLPQPKWLHIECGIPENAYGEMGVQHRAMTRAWLRKLKPVCAALKTQGKLQPFICRIQK